MEDHIQGNEKALITLVEYGNYESPSCGDVYGVVKEIQMHFHKDLKLIFRNFFNEKIRPYAKVAVEVAEFIPKIQKDIESGKKSGVQNIPTFFINENSYEGLLKLENLVSAIHSVLSKKK